MIELFRKISALALHPTAEEGERNSAAIKAFNLLRKHGIISLPWPEPSPQYEYPLMGFGKYCDRSVLWVAKNNPSYLEWALADVKELQPGFRQVIQRALKEVYPA